MRRPKEALVRDIPRRRRAIMLLVLSPVGLWGGSARCAGRDHDAEVALAEALFQQGKRLLEKGDSAAACPKLAESLRLDMATGTLLALAMCHESEGRLASAWAEYAEVVTRAQTEGRTDREASARRSVRALEPRLSTLTVLVPDAAVGVGGLRVERDGESLAPLAWSTALPVDPGPHIVSASAPGRRPWSTVVQIGAFAERMTVPVPVLDPEGSPTLPDGRAPTLDARPEDRGSPATGSPVALGPAPATIALFAGVASDPISPALVAELAIEHRSRWGGALRAAWLTSNRFEQIDTEGEVTAQSYALRACAFRRFRAAREIALEAGPEVLLELAREQTMGLGGFSSASRAAWGLGLQGAADLRLTSRVSLSAVASVDYAPSDWAGTFEVTNRGEVLRPAPFRVLLGIGPRFALDW
jgi:hypothetical protein